MTNTIKPRSTLGSAESRNIICVLIGVFLSFWFLTTLLVQIHSVWWTQGLWAVSSILVIIAVAVVAEPAFTLLTDYFSELDMRALKSSSILVSIDPMTRWPVDLPKPRTFAEWLDGQPVHEREELNTLYNRIRFWFTYG